MDTPSNDEPANDFGTADQDLIEEISVEIVPPSEYCWDATGKRLGPVSDDCKVTTGTSLESVTEEEIAVEGLPSQGDLDSVEPWTPDGEIPTIMITPPSEVDPEESEYDGDYEFENAGDHPDDSVAEVVPVSPTSPMGDDPYRSPMTTSGMFWSDDESNDCGPLPAFQTEARDPPAGGETSNNVADICETSNGM